MMRSRSRTCSRSIGTTRAVVIAMSVSIHGGIPFERYSAVGQYQPLIPKDKVRVRGFNHKQDHDFTGYKEYLKSIYTEKVDALSRVPHGPVVDGMQQLKKYLLKDRKDEIVENIIRRLMTYGIGRQLSYRDRFEVEKLLTLAEEEGYRFQEMIVSICLSPTFIGTENKEE